MNESVQFLTPPLAEYADDLTRFLDCPPRFLELLPIAIYACDAAGRVLWFNSRAADLWGRAPRLGDDTERFCGSHRIYLDGREIGREDTPMAAVLRTGEPVHGAEAVIERPDGSQVRTMVHIDPVKDAGGRLVGAINCFHDTSELHRASRELHVKQQDLEDFFENGAVALHLVAGDGTIIRANQAELDLLGYAAEDYVGRPIGDFHADRDAIEDILARLGRGDKLDNYPARLRAKDGSIRHVLITSNAQFHDGQFVNTRCFTLDVTEWKRAQDKVVESEQRLRQLLEALPAAIYTTDADGRIDFYNQAAIDLSGRRPTLGSDEWCVTWRLYRTDGTPLPHDECPMAVALKENRPVRGAEAVAERPDGTRVPFIPYPTPLRDASGELVGAVNMLVDITERKRAEERQNALLAELNHRVKNTLATVQSIAAQTIRGAGLAEDVRRSFDGRLFALSGAHDQLSREGWESAELSAILREIFAPFRTDAEDRIRFAGEPVKLPPKAAVTLAMVLHELATNAAKYGSLSVPGGSVSVAWDVDESAGARDLRIEWQEADGPAVAQPAGRGFGTRLLERGIASELRGSARMVFDPAGLRGFMTVPLASNASA